jgi:threonine synthase
LNLSLFEKRRIRYAITVSLFPNKKRLPHISYLFSLLCFSLDFKLDIVLPTGAMGNLAGAYMAKRLLGLPLGRLCAGVNVNDFTNVMFSTGRIQKANDGQVMKQTLSEAINIQLPYNLERILFYLTSQNHALIKEWYTGLEETNAVEIGPEWLRKLQMEFCAARVTDEELCETIQNVVRDWNYFADPHTSVALCAAEKLGYDIAKTKDKSATTATSHTKTAVAIIATASPCKFQEAMTTALGDSKWQEYMVTKFPKSGLDTMEKLETPPVSYTFDKSKNLAGNQKDWERLSGDIIRDL